MFLTILGFILLLLPLLCFKFHKAIGFILVTQLSIGLFTQLFGIFTYPIVFGLNLLVAIWLFKKIRFKVNWTMVAIGTILLFQFYAVHYDYTGEVILPKQQLTEVESLTYSFPYASDEWYAASIAKHAQNTHKLPFNQPLREDISFVNLQIGFHSLISEIFLLLNVDIVQHYGLLVMLLSTCIGLLVFSLLRLCKLRESAAVITALLIPYIASSGNLFTLWNAIPATAGIIAMLLSFCFTVEEDEKKFLLFSFLSLLLYPPLVVFLLPCAFFGLRKESRGKFLGIVGISGLLVFILALITAGSFQRAFSFIWEKIYYISYTPVGITQFAPWHVLPIVSLVFLLFSYRDIKKHPWLIAVSLIGVGYWISYQFSMYFFVISQPRVIFVAALLLIITSGFGVHRLSEFWKSYDKKVIAIILLVFAVLSFSYTEDDRYKNFLLIEEDVRAYMPAPTAGAYLHESDLNLFGNLKQGTFLSTPWKSTVIAITTGHTPASIKAGTFGYYQNAYADYLQYDCYERERRLVLGDIDYVYGREETCNFFTLLNISDEGFHLYAFTPNDTLDD